MRLDTGKIVLAPLLPRFAGCEIAAEVAEALGAPAVAENDCNVGVLGELWFHESEITGSEHLVALSVGIGVGIGLILNSRMYRGHDLAWAGQFGRMAIHPAGPKCRCGRRGCWELYVSDAATLARYDPTLTFSPEVFEKLIRLALARDAAAVCAFRETAEFLSLGLSNISMALNPSAIVVAGEITRAWELIHGTVQSAWKVSTPIRLSRFSLQELYSQGAIVLALEDVFAAPKLARLPHAPTAGDVLPSEAAS